MSYECDCFWDMIDVCGHMQQPPSLFWPVLTVTLPFSTFVPGFSPENESPWWQMNHRLWQKGSCALSDRTTLSPALPTQPFPNNFAHLFYSDDIKTHTTPTFSSSSVSLKFTLSGLLRLSGHLVAEQVAWVLERDPGVAFREKINIRPGEEWCLVNTLTS